MKLQPNIGNLNLHHRWLKFGLDEFLCINFQIFAGNCEKSNLAISWDALLSAGDAQNDIPSEKIYHTNLTFIQNQNGQKSINVNNKSKYLQS